MRAIAQVAARAYVIWAPAHCARLAVVTGSDKAPPLQCLCAGDEGGSSLNGCGSTPKQPRWHSRYMRCSLALANLAALLHQARALSNRPFKATRSPMARNQAAGAESVAPGRSSWRGDQQETPTQSRRTRPARTPNSITPVLKGPPSP